MKRTGRFIAPLVVVLGAAVLAPAAVHAQQMDLPTTLSPEYTVVQEPVGYDSFASLSLSGRLSFIGGDLDSFVFDGPDYSDIFDMGTGFEVEADVMFQSLDWYLGGYLSVSWDRYNGDLDVAAPGNSLEPDEMDILTVMAGFKGHFPFAPGWYTDMYAGIGVANYSDVDGVLTSGGVPGQVEVFSSTSAFAFELGAHIGFSRERFFAQFGLGVRVQGPPDESQVVLDPEAPAILFLEAGIGFRF